MRGAPFEEEDEEDLMYLDQNYKALSGSSRQ